MMKKREVQYPIAICLLIFTGMLNLAFHRLRNSPTSDIDMNDVPVIIGRWVGHDLPVSEDTYAILGTDKVIERKYVDASRNATVDLAVVFSQSNWDSFHSPTVCYPAAGWTVVHNDTEPVDISSNETPIDPARKLIIQKSDRKQVVLYWYKSGGKLTSSLLKQRVYGVLGSLWSKGSGGALIRVSTPITNGDIDAATAMVKEFSREAIPAILKGLQ